MMPPKNDATLKLADGPEAGVVVVVGNGVVVLTVVVMLAAMLLHHTDIT